MNYKSEKQLLKLGYVEIFDEFTILDSETDYIGPVDDRNNKFENVNGVAGMDFGHVLGAAYPRLFRKHKKTVKKII